MFIQTLLKCIRYCL